MDIFELWDKVLAAIDEKDHQYYQMFFNDVYPFSMSDTQLVFSVTKPYLVRWINNMYREKLVEIVKNITGKTVSVDVYAQGSEPEKASPAAPEMTPETIPQAEEDPFPESFHPEKEAEPLPLSEKENPEDELIPPDFSGLTPKTLDQVDLPDIHHMENLNEGSLFDNIPKKPERPAFSMGRVNKEFTFENFVHGNCNEMAYQAARAVAETAIQPKARDQNLNPLFIYGPSGLGKTHLLHAICNYVNEKRPDMKVLFVSSEAFTNELIDAIQKHTMPKFREKYRNLDFLLIDDVQFFGSRDSTKMEIFNTFNELYDKKKYIILTSDRTPADIEKLEARLQSRFSSGLVAQISPPDYEICCIILRKRAEKNHISLPENVVDYIASHINTNVRELEGAFKKLFTYSKIKQVPITLEFTREALKDQIPLESPQELSVDFIIDTVCKYYGVKKEAMLARGRPKKIVIPRQMAMFISRKELDISFPTLRDAFHVGDHSTVIYACERVQKRLENDRQTREDVEAIEKLLKNR